MARPPNFGWLASNEVETTLPAALEEIDNVLSLLKEHGKITITQGGKDQVVEPSEHVTYIFRYERLPKGELAVKIELKWLPGTNEGSATTDGTFKIAGPT